MSGNKTNLLKKFYQKNFTSIWTKIILWVGVIVIIPCMILIGCLAIYLGGIYFLYEHLQGSLSLDFEGLLIIIITTILIFLVHHFLSKKRSLPTLVNRIIIVVFIEIVIWVWEDVWAWHYLVTHSIEGTMYPRGVDNMIEITLNYVRAILTIVGLASMLIVSKLFWPRIKK